MNLILVDFLFIYLFIYFWLCWVFVSVQGLFSICGKWGPLFIAVRGPLTIAASPVAEHRLQMRRLSNCGSRAQLLCSMWDLPRPGLEPMSPALAGRFSTTAPPGKPLQLSFKGTLSFRDSMLKFLQMKLYDVWDLLNNNSVGEQGKGYIERDGQGHR